MKETKNSQDTNYKRSVHPDLLSSLSTSFVWPTDDCSKHLPGAAESRDMTVTVGCLLWLVAGLWTCGLVTGGPPHRPPSLSDPHRAGQSDHGTAMEMELQQQASQIDSLKRQIAVQTEQIAAQTASFQSQLAALTAQMTSSCDAHRAVRSDDDSPMEVELQQQASEITNLKAEISSHRAQLTANRAEISTLQDRLAQVTIPLVFSGESRSTHNYNDGDTIHFDRVLANVGGMYTTLSGIVTVPQDGVYFIFLRADPPDSSLLVLDLRVNGVHQVTAYAENGAPSSVAVALSLHVGNTVHVVKHSDSNTRSVETASNLSVVRVSA